MGVLSSLSRSGAYGIVEQRPEAHGSAVVPAAALGARGPPLAAHVLDVSAPPTAGAVGPPHVLPEGGGHGLLARVGKVDARHVEEASPLHVLDDVVAHARIVCFAHFFNPCLGIFNF